jgi:hypothetical protein
MRPQLQRREGSERSVSGSEGREPFNRVAAFRPYESPHVPDRAIEPARSPLVWAELKRYRGTPRTSEKQTTTFSRPGSIVQQSLAHQPVPHVVITIGEDGSIDSTLNGELFLAGPLGRDLVGELVGCIAEQHCGPIRLEMRDGDRAIDLQEMIGEGFLPGENVAIAVIVGERRVAPNGHLEVVVERILSLPERTDVILFGTSSGTLVYGGTW